MDRDPFLPDLMGSLEEPPAWIKTEILFQRMKDWPRWAHVAWAAGILRARGEVGLANLYRATARQAWAHDRRTVARA